MSPFSQSDLEVLRETIDSGQFTMSKRVREFETEFAKRVGSNFAVMVNSGSSANLLALSVLKYLAEPRLKPGAEVVAPALAWSTTWAPIEQLGFRIRLVDIEPDSLNVSAKAFEAALTPETRAAVGVSILGNPIAANEWRRICNERGIWFIEDNCESIGAHIDGRWLGTFGHVGTFSFFYSHHISTMEGGMVVTDDEHFYRGLLSMRAHGWTRDWPEEKGKSDYRFVLPGYNLRPLELSGALGLRQLNRLDDVLRIRRQNAQLFRQMMQAHPQIQIQTEKVGESSWYAFTMVLADASLISRDWLMQELRAAGIDSRTVTGGCFLRHPMREFFSYTASDELKNSLRVHDQGLFVANHGKPLNGFIEQLSQVLARVGA